jgi:hypothetical protein
MVLTEAQFRTLKKWLEVLGKDYPDNNDYTRGQKAAFRQVRKLLDEPDFSLSHVVENNLDKLAAR